MLDLVILVHCGCFFSAADQAVSSVLLCEQQGLMINTEVNSWMVTGSLRARCGCWHCNYYMSWQL